MEVIAGLELTRNSVWSSDHSSHVLLLGVESVQMESATGRAPLWLDPNGDLLTVVGRARRGVVVSVVAHPVSTRKVEKQTYYLWKRREELKHLFDAWEVASGPHWFTEVAESGLPLLATSDLHVPRQIRAWKTAFKCERKKEAILDAIRAQELSFQFFEYSSV